MPQAITCSQCSAPVADDRWSNCPFCGAVLDKPTLNPLYAVTAPERFEAARRHPAFARLMARKDSEIPIHGPQLSNLVLGGAALAAAMFAFTTTQGHFVGVVVGLTFLVVGGLTVFRGLGVAHYASGARLQRVLAVWRDERTEMSGGGDFSVSTRHFALLETEDGRREELDCSKALAGAHAPNDIGVAYLRPGALVDFQRIPV